MISAAGIPMIEADVEALSGLAAALGAAGGDFATAGADLHTTWQGLAAHYRAPEAEYLFASTGPVRDTTMSVGEDVEVVASTLAAYAEEVRRIQARLEALRVAAGDFEASVAHQPEWSADRANVDRSNELLGQVTAAMLDFDDAQRRCANAIGALHGGSAYRISDGDGIAELGEFGSTAAELRAMADRDAGVAWGRTAELDDDAVDEGNWLADAGHTVLDVAGLVPGLGEVADGANAAWYAADGDHVNAALSAAAMVPFGGWAATGAKFARRGSRAARSDNLAQIIGTLRDARRGKGNFGLGSGTRDQAEEAGSAWVGEGYTIASDGVTRVSQDELRQYRPPSFKRRLGRSQANFEGRQVPRGEWQSNGHLDIEE